MGFLVELLGAVVGVTVTGNAAEAEAGGQNARALKTPLSMQSRIWIPKRPISQTVVRPWVRQS